MKIQIQYSGDITTMLLLARGENTQDSYTTRFEIEVKGKREKNPKLYEITFGHKGNMLKIEEIIFKNTDNLEF
jgi:hypothetical protein